MHSVQHLDLVPDPGCNMRAAYTSGASVRTSGFRLSVFRFRSVFSYLRLLLPHNLGDASHIVFTNSSYSGKEGVSMRVQRVCSWEIRKYLQLSSYYLCK
jgi:hypothetical protein